MTTAEAPARPSTERLADISALAAMSAYIQEEATRLGLKRAAETAGKLCSELRSRIAEDRAG